ncbi:WAT1-related protein [Pyrus ussuriensis x Pyrus communis]|uniref:WAT1-related protein n=1 Tax=Pyrus ussuriensis x Pyrus communis TaxID=2448454 RepID=A0A5N5GAQ1_9ROSA|nr:WAT1-related protein [Pyrus ussuriensis x Pyrus communis]
MDEPSEKLQNLKSLNSLLLKETKDRQQQVESLVQGKADLEKFDMVKLGMHAKTGGTLVGFPSATLMILYKRIATVRVEMDPAPIVLTLFACLSGNLLTGIMAAILDHKASSWKLSWNITLLAPVYSGVVTLGIVIYVQTVLVRTRGPVFMTAFRPLSTIVAAVL